jgi:hypothetical protein
MPVKRMTESFRTGEHGAMHYSCGCNCRQTGGDGGANPGRRPLHALVVQIANVFDRFQRTPKVLQLHKRALEAAPSPQATTPYGGCDIDASMQRATAKAPGVFENYERRFAANACHARGGASSIQPSSSKWSLPGPNNRLFAKSASAFSSPVSSSERYSSGANWANRPETSRSCTGHKKASACWNRFPTSATHCRRGCHGICATVVRAADPGCLQGRQTEAMTTPSSDPTRPARRRKTNDAAANVLQMAALSIRRRECFLLCAQSLQDGRVEQVRHGLSARTTRAASIRVASCSST